MAQHFIGGEVLYNRHFANPKFYGDRSSAFSSALNVADNPIVTGIIPFLDDMRPGAGWVVEAVGYVSSSGGDVLTVQTIFGQARWSINGVATDNGGIPAIQEVPTVGIGRQTPQYRLTFDGAAQAALIAMAGDPNSLAVELRYRPLDTSRTGYFHGFCTFGDCMNVPPNVIPGNQTSTYINAQAYIEDFLVRIASASSSARYNVAPVGTTPRYVNGCGFASIDVSGFVIVESSDIGVGVGQIPQSVTDNTAERFRYHPNTFFRHLDHVSGCAVRRGDATAINAASQGSQPVGIYVNDDTIVDSTWLVVLDGQVQVLKLHIDDVALTPRTPLQIWEQVWFPLLSGSDATARGVLVNTGMKFNKQSYLQYARMVNRVGTETTQTNTPPPG